MKNNDCICIIPARGGSKGIHNKNIIDINGYPLIYYSIKASVESKMFNRVIVSTDSNKIAKIAKKYGAEIPFMRPEYLSTDDSLIEDTLCYVLEEIYKKDKKYKYVCLIQPTSPLLDKNDIINSINLLYKKRGDMVVSVGELPFNINWARPIPKNLSMKKFSKNICGTNKQCFENTYFLNGAIYLGKWDIFYNKKDYYKQKTFAYIMPYKKSIDIDNYDDLELVKFLLNNNK